LSKGNKHVKYTTFPSYV
jgi:hypothetical protein